MASLDFINDQRRAAQEAAELARESARLDALDELMADPRLLPRADAANAEVAALERAAAKATESFDQLDQQMQKATIAGDEKELSRLEGLFGARKRLRDHAVDALSEAHSRHELLRSAARIFREREQLDNEWPALEGRGRAVEEATNHLIAHVGGMRDALHDCVVALGEAIRAHNEAGKSFDARAESARCDKRVGRVQIERVLADVVTALRDRDWQHTGEALNLALTNNGNTASLVFSFTKKSEVKPWQL